MWKKKEKKRKLVNMDISEVSLVDLPANRRSFFLVKAERRKEMSFLKMLKKIIGAPTAEEKNFAKSLDNDSVEALTEAVEVIGEYQDDMPSETVEAFNVLVKAACYGSYVPEKDEDDEDDEDSVDKAGARISKEVAKTLKELAAYMKDSAEMTEIQVKAARTQLKVTKTQSAKLDELLGLAKGEVKPFKDEDEDEDEDDVEKKGVTDKDVKKLMGEVIEEIMSGEEQEDEDKE